MQMSRIGSRKSSRRSRKSSRRSSSDEDEHHMVEAMRTGATGANSYKSKKDVEADYQKRFNRKYRPSIEPRKTYNHLGWSGEHGIKNKLKSQARDFTGFRRTKMTEAVGKPGSKGYQPPRRAERRREKYKDMGKTMGKNLGKQVGGQLLGAGFGMLNAGLKNANLKEANRSNVRWQQRNGLTSCKCKEIGEDGKVKCRCLQKKGYKADAYYAEAGSWKSDHGVGVYAKGHVAKAEARSGIAAAEASAVEASASAQATKLGVKAEAEASVLKAKAGLDYVPFAQASAEVLHAGASAGASLDNFGAVAEASLASASAGPFAIRAGVAIGARVVNGIPQVDLGPVSAPCSIM